MGGSWVENKLRDLGSFRNGVNFSKNDYGTGRPLINVKQLYGGRYIPIDDLKELNPDTISNPDAVEVQKGDILFARSSVKASGAGQVAMVNDFRPGTVFSGFIIRFRVEKHELVIPEYLNYLLRSPVFRELLTRIASGTTITNLSQGTLGNLRIPLPPISKQRHITHILGTLDDKIELNRRMNATLEAIARAIFKSWFVDFDPVRAKMDGRDTGLPDETADLFSDSFDASELGKIPRGWEAQQLEEFIDVNPSRRLPKAIPAPYLEMANMPEKGHRPQDWYLRPYGSGVKFINGDTLLARITPCLENGKTAYVDFLEDEQIGWGSTEYIVMRPKEPYPLEFAYFLARSDDLRAHAIINMTGSSGRQRVPPDAIKQYSFAAPLPKIALAFGDIARAILNTIKANDEQSRTLSELRDTLLPKLIQGYIKIV